MYFKKLQTTILKLLYQTPPYSLFFPFLGSTHLLSSKQFQIAHVKKAKLCAIVDEMNRIGL